MGMGARHRQCMSFSRHFQRRISELSKTRVAMELNYAFILLILIGTSHGVVGQPLWMAAHASNWGYPLIPHRKGGLTACLWESFVG